MKPIARVWIFASSSGRGKYETLQYDDGTISCGCPGWTRRTAPDGSRSCKHTRLVDMGRADSECEAMNDYSVGRAHRLPPPKATGAVALQIGFGGRKLCL